ncbi:hypothetical protein [Bradyrhizobium sp. BWA-3-5]|uniref:hypothetical protein n=1 Tax=Bradyrhizobium sp. BWA-3-5 TaxID=3080013 RepID=UPI00293F266A|nr:hypothetical protein [Bradyrhizobium sp. BWA-3-5]WOH63677.1 hypothetical protein RX331_23530 [Bradyrhizobium sp. BWA-3-5]
MKGLSAAAHEKPHLSAWPDWDIGQTHEAKSLTTSSFIEAAINGYGFVLVPEALVSLDIAERRLEILFPQSRIIGSGFYGLFNPSAHEARSVEQFIAWLTQQGSRLTPREDIDWS